MREKRIFYGWWIVSAASLIHFWGAATFFYGFTTFFNPLVQEFKWSYAATSLAASFRSLESGIAGPLVGFLTDRLGPRRVILIGAVWGTIGFIWLSRIYSLGSFYTAFLFLSIGMSLMFPIPGWTAVSAWFLRKRSLAMGILLGAVGLSGLLIPLVSWLITGYGWRAGFIIAGVGTLVIGVPLSLVVRHRPEQYGYLPDGEKDLGKETQPYPGQKDPDSNGQSTGLSVRQAIKTRGFWIFVLLNTVWGAVIQAVMVHVMPFLVSVQMSREVASSIAGSLALISIVGRMGSGWLGDRMDRRYLLASALLLQALGLVIFAYTRNLAQAIAFVALFGPGFGGAITLTLIIQADYFGRKAFGTIVGVMQGIGAVGGILSPVFAGWIYDVRGSYQLAWLALAILVFVSTPVVLALKPPKN